MQLTKKHSSRNTLREVRATTNASVGRTGELARRNSSQMVVKVQTEVVKDYCFSSLFYMLSNKKVYLLPNFYHVAMPYIF